MPSLQETLKPFRWLHEPAQWGLAQTLGITTDPDTDYWQRTHYGFRRDNGHFFYTELDGDFSLSAAFQFQPTAQYDQCGLMCRVDGDAWIKCSVEYETPDVQPAGVRGHQSQGFSDWATQDVVGPVTRMHYKLDRYADDFRLSWSTDGRDWMQMRITHLHGCPARLQAGIYACSPTGPGFPVTVDDLQIEVCGWRETH